MKQSRGINRRDALKASATTVACLSFASLSRQAHGSTTDRPNIIFILADDVGAESMEMYGSTSWPTPNINTIAQDGVVFENAFSCPTCAPTRGQFLTGRYPFRTGIVYPTLPLGELSTTNEVTLATLLQDSGYATGLSGKWNLKYGNSGIAEEQEAHIVAHGFAESSSFIGHTINYGNQYVEQDYTPYQLNEWACNFITNKASGSQPFYLQYSLGLVHTPLGGTPLFPNVTGLTLEQTYSYMMQYMDQMVGNLLNTVDALGIADNTVLIFAGDNGTVSSIDSMFNGVPVAGGKQSTKDTGSWVPFYVRWPGVVTPNTSYGGMMDFSDIFPTLLDIADVALPSDRIIDGKSFRSQLEGQAGDHREIIYVSHRQNPSAHFVRNHDWKLVLDAAASYDLAPGLYDISNAPISEVFIDENSQTQEQAAARTLLQNYYDQNVIGATLPPPAPSYMAENTYWSNPSSMWETVGFPANTFVDPIIVMGPVSARGSDPCVLRVRQVDSSQFEYQVDEWDYISNRRHARMNIGCMVFEKGNYTVEGLKVEAGVLENVGHAFVRHSFQSGYFSSKPLVFVQVVTTNETSCVTPRFKKNATTSDGFNLQLQEQEAGADADGDLSGSTAHAGEKVHYIAIEQGVAANGSFMGGSTARNLSDEWTLITFGASFPNPVLVANQNNRYGGDPIGLRHSELTPDSVKLMIEEENSNQVEGGGMGETEHTTESADWIVFSG